MKLEYLVLGEDQSLRVFENLVLRKIFDYKRKDVLVKRHWRKFHYEELHDRHSSSNSVRMISSRRARGALGRGKRLLGVPKRRWEDNIKIGIGREWAG